MDRVLFCHLHEAVVRIRVLHLLNEPLGNYRSAFAGLFCTLSYDRKLVTAGIGKAAYRGVA